MKKLFYIILASSNIFISKIYAADDVDNLVGIENDKLRNGDVTFSDIPKSLQHATGFILKFAAAIAIIVIIYGGLRYSLGSIEGSSPNKQKANDTIKYGIIGFVVAISSWYIINLIVNNI